MRYPSGDLRRLVYKTPLVEWRMGFGPIQRRFRFLVLTTRGRKSGRPRHTILELSMMAGKAYIAPGWGAKTQRNYCIFTAVRGTYSPCERSVLRPCFQVCSFLP